MSRERYIALDIHVSNAHCGFMRLTLIYFMVLHRSFVVLLPLVIVLELLSLLSSP